MVRQTNTVAEPRDVETSWDQQYAKVASKLVELLLPRRGVIVEIGCGKGQLTIPLAKQTRNHQITAVDSYRSPYSRRDYNGLVSALRGEKLKQRVRVVVSDSAYWLSRQAYGKFDAVISSEFLPEVDLLEMRKFLSECWRVAKPRGVTVHSFLSPVARNVGQKLLIEADSDPRWTKDPPKEWFSPRPRSVAVELKRAGFKNIRVVRMRSRLVFRAEAALTLLRKGGVRDAFWKRHQRYLRETGLEVPDWIVISGVKLNPRLWRKASRSNTETTEAASSLK